MFFVEGRIIKLKQMVISRKLLNKCAFFILPFFLVFTVEYCRAEVFDEYTRLLELIQLEDKQWPLYIFNDFEEEFDKASYRATRKYIEEHPGLIQRVRNKLEGGKLRWKLKKLKHRLLFVPEKRREYTTLYRNYCVDIIHAILDKTGMDNPYDSIQTLNQSKPAHHENKEGVTAYIVHNLVKEYVGTYIFSNQTDKKIKIELKGKLFSGEIGSYASTLVIDRNGNIEFLKDKYTIWQNSAANPYTALIVPAEETLHITLRGYTESAIKKSVEQSNNKSLKSVKRIVEDWMAVEEAIVGGIVYRLLPQILEAHMKDLSPSHIKMDIFAKTQFEKYRHLEEGITIVDEIGYREAIRMYLKDATAFRDLLL